MRKITNILLPAWIVINASLFPLVASAETTVSPWLSFLAGEHDVHTGKTAGGYDIARYPVTIRFASPPDEDVFSELHHHGAFFPLYEGDRLHSGLIYPAYVHLDSLAYFEMHDLVASVETSAMPSPTSTLNVSNPQVQASQAWRYGIDSLPLDGSGVTIAVIDTGIDIYHPGFFKPDAGTYSWLDVNGNGTFDSGIDAVDLNDNGSADTGELLAFHDAHFSDPLGLMERTEGVYDADIDWLYNDINGNGTREFGPAAGYSVKAPSFGELLFIIDDLDGDNRLSPGEILTGLGTTRILATYDKDGTHHRSSTLAGTLPDTYNHGTGSSGIAGGQFPGRRLVGMAPGVNIISINRLEANTEYGMLWAQRMGADIMMYEWGSWVYEFLDGTSNIESMITNLDEEGIVQVAGSGNLAGPTRKKHALATISPTATIDIPFHVPEIEITRVYASILWTGDISPPDFSLSHNSMSLPLSGDEGNHEFGELTVSSSLVTSSKKTHRMDVYIRASSSFHGDFEIAVSNSSSSVELTMDAYIADNITQWMNGTQFTAHVSDDGTITSPGTAENVITVGAYDPRGTRNTQGDINDFSSWGETIDGRRGVDITAPGTLVYSLSSHFADNSQPGGYIDFGGTSASIPHVAGCIALLLQANPHFTPTDVKEIIYSHALDDIFTGLVPNPVWGYGKLRIADAMIASPLSIEINEVNHTPEPFTVSHPYPNPFNSTVSITVDFSGHPEASLTFSVYTITGQKVYSHTLPASRLQNHQVVTWDGTTSDSATVSSGLYFLALTSGSHIVTNKVVFIQ